MEDTQRQVIRRRRERQRRQRNRRRRASIITIVVIAAIVLALFGIIRSVGSEPDQVTNLEAKATYAQMTLNWQKVSGADGYYIYASDGGDLKKIAEVEGKDNCGYTIKDYTHDQEYKFQVSAYDKGLFLKKIKEGPRSDMITAEYVSSDYAQKIPILAYHKVIPAGQSFESGLNITEDVLRKELEYLHDNGFKTLTLDEFYKWHAGKLEVPVKSCVITFDDGFYGVYYLAYPIIKEYGQAATMFLIGKNIEDTTHPYTPVEDGEQNHYVGKDVIEKVRAEYPRFEFESHTYDMHNRVDGKEPALIYSYEQIMEDIAMNEEYGFQYLAYPVGDYSETIQKALKDSGYKMAFAYRPFYYAKRSDDTYAVNRIKISGKMGMDKFIRIVNGESAEHDAP